MFDGVNLIGVKLEIFKFTVINSGPGFINDTSGNMLLVGVNSVVSSPPPTFTCRHKDSETQFANVFENLEWINGNMSMNIKNDYDEIYVFHVLNNQIRIEYN